MAYIKVEGDDISDSNQPRKRRQFSFNQSEGSSDEQDDVEATLLPKLNVKSKVWKYFGFRPNPMEGLEDQPLNKLIITCRLCMRDVKCGSESSTGNAFQHLLHNHRQEYMIVKPVNETTSIVKEEGKIMLLPKKNATSKVWKYFGFVPNPDEGMQDQPLDKEIVKCRICEKDIKYTGLTSNLRKHLRSHGQEEFMPGTSESESSTPRASCSSNQIRGSFDELDELRATLLPKLNARSKVWKYFGFRPNPLEGFEGQPLNKEIATCRLCMRDVKCDSPGNALQHLLHNHRQEYRTIVKPVNETTSIVKEEEKVILLQKKNATSKVWKYFGFVPNPDEGMQDEPLDKEIVKCCICAKDIKYTGLTSNLRKHLRSHGHEEFMPGTSESESSTPRACSSNQLDDVRATLLPKLNVKSKVWKYFGFRPNPLEGLEEQPLNKYMATCRLCMRDVKCLNSSTGSVLQHLLHNHRQEYRTIVKPVNDETTSSSNQIKGSFDELDDVRATLLPKLNAKSKVWRYFGFRPNPLEGLEEQPLNKEMATCRLCMRDVKCTKGSTGMLLQHLVHNHRQEYRTIVKPVNETASLVNEENKMALLPKKNATSKVWKFFGFVPNPNEGMQDEPLDKEIVKCRICAKDIKYTGLTTNLRKHMRCHRKEYFMPDTSETESSTPCSSNQIAGSFDELDNERATLLPKLNAKSKVWKYFGFRPNPLKGFEEQPLNKQIVTCRLCMRDVKCGSTHSTANAFQHLLHNHRQEYRTIVKPVNEITSSSNQIKGSFDELDNERATLLPKLNAKSKVWRYFGFRPDPLEGFEEQPLNKQMATCRLCMRDVNCTKGSTGSLIHHLLHNHRQEYRTIVNETTREPYSPSVAFSTDSQSSTANSEQALDSDTDSSMVAFKQAADSGHLCHRCKKSLVDTEVINNERAGAETPEGEIDYDYCWECFAVLHNIGFLEQDYPMDKDESVDLNSLTELSNANKTIKVIGDDVGIRDGPDEALDEMSDDTESWSETRSIQDDVVVIDVQILEGDFEICNRSNEGVPMVTADAQPGNAGDKSATISTDSEMVPLEASLDNKLVSSSTGVHSDCDSDGTIVFESVNIEQSKASCSSAVENQTFETTNLPPDIKTLQTTVEHSVYAKPSSNLDDVRKYYCKECNKTYANKRNLGIHRRRHDGKPNFLCCFCSKGFYRVELLKLHEHRHTGTLPRPHKCQTCGKAFISRGKLNLHVMTHTGEKPHLCHVCGRGFNQRVVLRAHARTHTGEKPYACRICDKRFMQKSSKTTHEKTH